MAASLVLLLVAYIPPEQYRHEQITAMQSAFSRYGAQGLDGAIDKQDLQEFLRYVVGSMNSAAVPQDQVAARSADLSMQLLAQLPPEVCDARLLPSVPKRREDHHLLCFEHLPPTVVWGRKRDSRWTRSCAGRSASSCTLNRHRTNFGARGGDWVRSPRLIPGHAPSLQACSLLLKAASLRPLAGSKQLRTLRKRLERNRLTMPLFDTKGWVRARHLPPKA